MRALLNVLTVDPGVNTGWAFWNGGDLPLSTGVFRVTRDGSTRDIQQQLCELWMNFENLLEFLSPQTMVIENNSWWPGSVRSTVSAMSGDLRKLTMVTGGYCAIAYKHNVTWELVEPSKWKGQLTDEALAAQMEFKIGKIYRQHEREAVGIGLWKSGRL